MAIEVAVRAGRLMLDNNFDHSTIFANANTGVNKTELIAAYSAKHQHLFSSACITISSADAIAMANIIKAIETVVSSIHYQDAVIKSAPAIAHYQLSPPGALLGYDFHLTPSGPRLIEINTNPGGALLNLLLARTQQERCKLNAPLTVEAFESPEIEQQFYEMFLHEWRLQRGELPLQTIAIVDEQPTQQFLYPEFLLYKQLFERNHIKAIVIDPAELVLKEDKLHYQDIAIDLIYNRLTDFYLANSQNAIIAEAYLNNSVVLTPHPRAHALYANKANLALLCNEQLLRSWHVAESDIYLLINGVPKTCLVDVNNKENLWRQRDQLFFKPLHGYGSKGSYRGDKLTHKRFNEIIKQNYIAQEFVPASEHLLTTQNSSTVLKVDIRCYVYQAQIQLFAARLYQGQTTNFRTSGGGFAAVIINDNNE